jgi:2-polyprenyl-3-methyl-5-hydroxy-6-metoxy-1,4-benzoquinol methylase
MDTQRRDFDSEAASWDEKPYRVKLAEEIAGAITKQVTVSTDMDVMDFGAGTGLLTMHLQPMVRSITGVDSSPGMLDVLSQKIDGLGLTNIKTMVVDLDKGDELKGSYDLIVSSMTLHHVRDVKALFHQFHAVLKPSGHLCVADLDSDDGQFHRDITGVFHFGFDRMELGMTLRGAGFDGVRDALATEISREIPNGEMRTFTIFLMSAQRD